MTYRCSTGDYPTSVNLYCDSRLVNGFNGGGDQIPKEFIVVNFGTDTTICGFVFNSRFKNGQASYVNEFEVLISQDNILYTSIGNFFPDNIFSNSNSILQFANSVTTKFIKFVVIDIGTTSWTVELTIDFLQNCGTCPAGQFGCSNTDTGTASCIVGENPNPPPPPPPPPPPSAGALPAKEMTCDAIPCGTDTCKNIYFRDFLNLKMYWMVVWCSPGDFFCNMYRCDSIL